MKQLAKKPQKFPINPAFQPKVAILMAAWNEDKILEQKLLSMLQTDYPLDKIEIWVGSDNSTDKTNEILAAFAEKFTEIKYKIFTNRTGKPQIINNLFELCQAEILILTDADTLFSPDTIPNLVAPFQEEKIGGVQAKFVSLVAENKDVGKQEVMYNNRELDIKRGESRKGAVIGAYGACYALRKSLYIPVPQNFIVDDFFIFMQILAHGFQTVLNEDAICEMEISGNSGIEFKRKVRIGTGNYQNLYYFKNFLNPFFSFAKFAYISHKVLRWLTPFFLISTLSIHIILAFLSKVYLFLLIAHSSLYVFVLIDSLLAIWNVNFLPFRFIRHFVSMNWALFNGFIQFLNGVKKSSWENN